MELGRGEKELECDIDEGCEDANEDIEDNTHHADCDSAKNSGVKEFDEERNVYSNGNERAADVGKPE